MAPFKGTAILSSNENEVILTDVSSLPAGSEIIITNVEPDPDIMSPDEEFYVEKQVQVYKCTYFFIHLRSKFISQKEEISRESEYFLS